MVHLDTYINLANGISNGSWVEKNVSAYLKAGDKAKIVVLRIFNTSATGTNYWGARCKGSTTNIKSYSGDGHQGLIYVAVDEYNKLEIFREWITIQIWLVGYFTDKEAGAWVDPKNKTLGVTSAWTDIDIRADVPDGTLFAVWNVRNSHLTPANQTFGIRPNGSVDSFATSIGSTGVIMPVDDDMVVEAYMTNITSSTLDLVGYIFLGEKKIDGLDKSIGTTGVWTDVNVNVDTPPSGYIGACVLFHGFPIFDYRKDGIDPTVSLYAYGSNMYGFPIECINHIFEIKIYSLLIDTHIYGYFGVTTSLEAETIDEPVIIADSRFEDSGATISASSTDADVQYSVQHIKDGRSYTKWKAGNTNTPCFVKVTGASGNVNSLGILAHNLATIGATLQLQASSDDFVCDLVVWPEFTPTDDKAIMKCLASAAGRDDVRLWITGVLSAPPEIAVLKAGTRLTFPYPPDPGNFIDEGTEEKSSVSNEGMDLGTTVFYHDNKVEPEFSNLLRTWVMSIYKTFWDIYGKKRKRFFFAPNLVDFPNIIHWARFKKGSRFEMPLTTSVYVDKLKLEMESITEE